MFVFIPFVIQSILCVIYFSTKLHEDLNGRDNAHFFYEFFILLLTFYFIFHEILQLIEFKRKDKGIWGITSQNLYERLTITNVMEISSAFLNLLLIVNEWTDRRITNGDWHRLFVLIAIGLVWFKAFYWMRLFEKHAFFMNLLYKTFQGIRSFVLMLAILIGCASNMIYVIIKVDHDYTLLQGNKMPPIFS